METDPPAPPADSGQDHSDTPRAGWRWVAALCALLLGLAGTLHLYQQRQVERANQRLADLSAVQGAISVATAWLAATVDDDAKAASARATVALATARPAIVRLGQPGGADTPTGSALPTFLEEVVKVRSLLAQAAPEEPPVLAALPLLRSLDERGQDMVAALRADADQRSARLDFAFVVAYGLALGVLLLASARLHRVQRGHRQAARQLRDSEARHRAMFHALGEGVLVFDRQGHVESCNPAAEMLLGRSLAAMRANDLTDWATLDISGRRPPPEELPVAIVLKHGLAQRDITMADVNPSGLTRWFSVSAAPLREPASNHISGAVVSFIDITERRRIQAELSASEATTRALMNSMADGVFVAQDFRCVYANDALPAMLGYSREEFSDLPFERLVAPEMLALCTERFTQRLDDGQAPPPASYDLRLMMRDGVTELEFEMSASRVSYRGRPAVMGVLRDVTQRKKAAEEHALRVLNTELTIARDKAEAAGRAKSVFLANMSHEIRTPMNAIIGLTHLLRREQVEPRTAERLVRIGDAAQHLMGIVNDMLDLSRIESGTLLLEPADFGLGAMLERTCALVVQQARDKGLEMVIDTAAVPDGLRGDPKRLSQALLNLLSNAVKFTDAGTVSLTGSVQHRSGRHVMVRFEVCDTGIGIAPHQVERIFSSFEQADGSSTRRFGGAGLGLGITRHLARLMGGDAGAQSRPGQGSLFWLTVRLQLSELPPPAVEPDLRLAGKHALVVDDLAEAREVMLEMLHHLGLRTAAASSGEEARRLAREAEQAGDAFEVALIDWLMPGMDGIATAHHILTEARGNGPACIMVSTSEDSSLREHALELGITTLLPKPVSLAALQRQLGALLLDRSAGPAPAAPDLQAETLLRDRHAGARVLLAEDNPVNQDVAMTLLEIAGLQVDVANNGREAVAMASAAHYDLILMDMQMPVLDGPHASRLLRQQPATAHTPIIAMTANAYARDRDTCLAAGMNDHLTKPVDPPVLYETLLRWLHGPGGQAGGRLDAEAAADTLAALPGGMVRHGVPAIDGLDTARGLAFFAGNQAVYRQTLGRFADLYGGGIAALDDYLAERGPAQHEALKRELHSLGGASAAIGATELAELSRHLGEWLDGGAGRGGVDDSMDGDTEGLAQLRELKRRTGLLTAALAAQPPP